MLQAELGKVMVINVLATWVLFSSTVKKKLKKLENK